MPIEGTGQLAAIDAATGSMMPSITMPKTPASHMALASMASCSASSVVRPVIRKPDFDVAFCGSKPICAKTAISDSTSRATCRPCDCRLPVSPRQLRFHPARAVPLPVPVQGLSSKLPAGKSMITTAFLTPPHHRLAMPDHHIEIGTQCCVHAIYNHRH